MKHADLTKDAPGELVSVLTATGSRGLAFLPNPLPIEIELTPDVQRRIERAAVALGNLNGVGNRISNPLVFAQPFLKQEAVHSTRIEGSQTNLEQLVLFELEHGDRREESPDSLETLNYVKALNAGWENVDQATESKSGMLHLQQMLLESVRGRDSNPGNFRDVPVYLGGRGIEDARFVPPPPEHVPALIDNLLGYVTESPSVPRLVQLAIIHYQFETIHPFSDGNGRTGRLLLPLYLKRWGLLDQPLLFLSSYFEQHKREYIDYLFEVSTRNDWNQWLAFFLDAVYLHSLAATRKAHQLLDMHQDLRLQFHGDRSPHVLPIIDMALQSLAVTVPDIEQVTGASRSTVYGIMRKLVNDGVFRRVPLQGGTSAYFLNPLWDVIMEAPDQ